MTRVVSACPYCRTVAAGPDRRPCPHLAFVIADLAAYDSFRNQIGRAGGSWVWARGGSVEAVPSGASHPLREWVERVALRFAAPDEWPTIEYRVTGGTDT